MPPGYHGPQDMPKLIAWARGQMAKGQHFVSATVGDPGTGKSGFNQCLAIALQAPHPFDPRRQIAMRPTDRKALSQQLPPGYAVLDDETTGMGGHRRRSMSNENVTNNQDMDTMRGRRQATLLTCPDYSDLDEDIKKHVQWVFALAHDHTAIVWENVKSGGRPDHLFHNLTRRFSVEDIPHASILAPSVWRSYIHDLKNPFLAGVNVQARNQQEDYVERIRPQLRRLLDG